MKNFDKETAKDWLIQFYIFLFSGVLSYLTACFIVSFATGERVNLNLFQTLDNELPYIQRGNR